MLYPTHAGDALALLGKAEEELYLARRQGRHQAKLPSDESMILTSNSYACTQLERLTRLARKAEQSEAALLREVLNRLLSENDISYHVAISHVAISESVPIAISRREEDNGV